MTDATISALASVVAASLASLESILDDMETHPKAGIRRATDEAETLSRAAQQLVKSLIDAPGEKPTDTGAPPDHGVDIETVAAVLDRVRDIAASGRCPECGGVQWATPNT